MPRPVCAFPVAAGLTGAVARYSGTVLTPRLRSRRNPSAYRLGAAGEDEIMLAQDHAQTARDFLVAADREFTAGDVLQASEKLWGAAAHAITAVAKQRGLNHGTHRTMINAARQIAEERDDERLRSGILAAQHFHSNFYNGTMEDEDIAYDRPLVQRFVALMLALTN